MKLKLTFQKMRRNVLSLTVAATVSTVNSFKGALQLSTAKTFSSPFSKSTSTIGCLLALSSTVTSCNDNKNRFQSVSRALPSIDNKRKMTILNDSVSPGQSSSRNEKGMQEVDAEYPGTATTRLNNVRARVSQLSEEDLSGEWQDVRRKILWAGGLRDLPDAVPGQGYTGHAFNDYNHVDLTTMNDGVQDSENDGKVKQIAVGNRLGQGIRIASLPELGPGGSWSTCANGCHVDPPQDVAHVQFRSRIAFKLVWVPGNGTFNTFLLVDDDGNELARGNPSGRLPDLRQRQMNYRLVSGSKYARVADQISAKSS